MKKILHIFIMFVLAILFINYSQLSNENKLEKFTSKESVATIMIVDKVNRDKLNSELKKFANENNVCVYNIQYIKDKRIYYTFQDNKCNRMGKIIEKSNIFPFKKIQETVFEGSDIKMKNMDEFYFIKENGDAVENLISTFKTNNNLSSLSLVLDGTKDIKQVIYDEFGNEIDDNSELETTNEVDIESIINSTYILLAITISFVTLLLMHNAYKNKKEMFVYNISGVGFIKSLYILIFKEFIFIQVILLIISSVFLQLFLNNINIYIYVLIYIFMIIISIVFSTLILSLSRKNISSLNESRMNKLFYGFINCFSAFVFIILIYNLSAITTNCMSLKAYYNDYKNNQETYFIIETEGDGLNEMISNYKALMNALDSEAITTMQHKDNTDFTEITYDFKSLIKLGYLDQKEISDIKECVYVYNGKALKKNGYEIKREILPENLNCSFYDKDINFSQESYMIGDKHLSEKESVYFSNLEDNFLIQNIVVKNKSKVEIEKVIDEVYKGSDQDTKPKVLSYYENYSSDIFSTIDGLSKLIVLFVIYIVIFVYVLITYIYFIFEFFSKHLSIATFMGLRNSLIYKPIIINILLINVIVFLITNLLSQFYWINNVVFTIVFIIQVIIIIKFSKKYYENEIIESLKEL